MKVHYNLSFEDHNAHVALVENEFGTHDIVYLVAVNELTPQLLLQPLGLGNQVLNGDLVHQGC